MYCCIGFVSGFCLCSHYSLLSIRQRGLLQSVTSQWGLGTYYIRQRSCFCDGKLWIQDLSLQQTFKPAALRDLFFSGRDSYPFWTAQIHHHPYSQPLLTFSTTTTLTKHSLWTQSSEGLTVQWLRLNIMLMHSTHLQPCK